MGIARKKKKKTLKAKMLGILTMCAMTSLLAAVIVSYMELRMIQNDSIEDNMKMYLDQITKNTDEAYYDMISIVNYMGPGGLIGNVTDSYLDAVDNFDRFVEQRSLRQELLGLGYVNTKLVGATYYDKEEKKELISGMNVRTLDGRQNALPKVVKCAGNVMQAAHASFLGSSEKTVFSVMREVEQMKRQIENLISNMVEKEKSIQKIEFEKLLYQINPHFLLNTLNSIQWMAQMSHQREISEFVQRLKKLLSYNLGKEGRQTTLRMELEIVKEYIALQQMRYDFIIEMNIEDGSYLDQPTVRMLFQPLVENAIRYGLGDDEKISIQVFEDVARHLAVVTISDSGKGLNQEEIDEINQPFDYDWGYWKNENRGIGLRYVKAMLESFYDGQTSLFVNSKKGFGTKITILLPVREPEEKKEKDKEVTLEENKVGQTDERIDCR